MDRPPAARAREGRPIRNACERSAVVAAESTIVTARPERAGRERAPAREMGAAQQQRVGIEPPSPDEDPVEVAMHDAVDHRTVGPPLFGQRNEQRAGAGLPTSPAASQLIAAWYAPPRTVLSVASTDDSPLRVARQAAAAPGSSTPTTGTGANSSASASERPRMPCCTRRRGTSRHSVQLSRGLQ